ncbi:MAG: phosphate acyltransferase PlsX [Deltaproteobacteria bacterium]|nr:phosphate acyltransferase PlsX [Deltaproteobacteria bacterium]
MKIALDAMGGDFAPRDIVEGAVLAAREHGIPVVLVGEEKTIRQEAGKYPGSNSLPLTFVHASEAVGMDESPLTAIRKKKDSSIKVALDLLKKGEAEAVVSAGNSGAVLATAVFTLEKLSGVDRPAIGTIFPTLKGWTLLLDAGANVDCKPFHLVQFAIMGEAYAKYILKKDRPLVGLLSNGEEESKGNELIRETNAILKKSSLGYVGPVEGRDIFNGRADVVICDGFVGNAALKICEGLAEAIGAMIRQELEISLRAKIGYLFARHAVNDIKKKLDYSEYGGAPLLGVNGVVIIGHGRSSAKAIKNAIRLAHEFAQIRLPQLLVGNLEENKDLQRLGGKNLARVWEQIKEKLMD